MVAAVLSLGVASQAASQPYVTAFALDSVTAMSAVAPNGSYALAGLLDHAPLVLKVDGSGAIVWRRVIGGVGDVFSGVVSLQDGGYAAAGRSQQRGWIVRYVRS